jgi:hypothetical protein
MKSWLAVVSLVALVSCKASRWSGQKAAAALQIDGFTISIPEGWRSMAELNDSGDLAKYRPGPDSVGMMPDVDRDGVLTTSVFVTASPRSAVPAWATCAQAVENARARYSPPISDVHDGGSACTWHVSLGRLVGTVGIRIVGDREVAAQCLIDAGGDREAERVCADLLHTLQMP